MILCSKGCEYRHWERKNIDKLKGTDEFWVRGGKIKIYICIWNTHIKSKEISGTVDSYYKVYFYKDLPLLVISYGEKNLKYI